MSYEELVESKKCIGDMSKEELFEYCNGLLEEVWALEKKYENAVADYEQEHFIINQLEKWLKEQSKGRLERTPYDEVHIKLLELKDSDKE